jgi:hypothetical protein
MFKLLHIFVVFFLISGRFGLVSFRCRRAVVVYCICCCVLRRVSSVQPLCGDNSVLLHHEINFFPNDFRNNIRGNKQSRLVYCCNLVEIS